MNKKYTLFLLLSFIVFVIFSAFREDRPVAYTTHYTARMQQLYVALQDLSKSIQNANLENATDKKIILTHLQDARYQMKAADCWLRYLEPIAYKKINGPLPVEWETEVFEKFEKPYKREGAGLTLAVLYLDEEHPQKDSLNSLIRSAIQASEVYTQDSITDELTTYHHFFLCNRLFLLNLAAIYTTGFECPDGEQAIPELLSMLKSMEETYNTFNESFPTTPLTPAYLNIFRQTIAFVQQQPQRIEAFNHYVFIREYVNPLFAINQQMIREYKVTSHSLVDYSLNKNANSIFSKTLYNGQNTKGIFTRVTDSAELATLSHIGKQLFYDPILSGNNQRSCASCHKPKEYFTDTTLATSFQYDRLHHLNRNTPTLINTPYNHLIMLDGKHYTLQHQTKAVITSNEEMGADATTITQKVLSCKEYQRAFAQFLKYTPQEPTISFEHIVSAITLYYAQFSSYNAPFDESVNGPGSINKDAEAGFNLFMGKAQCATCHFVPQFNGVKPPYVGSEFEVLGVPGDKQYQQLSKDEGRYAINPATETRNAFRTGTVRNAAYTKPYMHNGVFNTLEEVVEFYDNGGGIGHGLRVINQTLAADSLKLTAKEKKQLISFIITLNESIPSEEAPASLPKSNIKALNQRKIGGNY